MRIGLALAAAVRKWLKLTFYFRQKQIFRFKKFQNKGCGSLKS